VGQDLAYTGREIHASGTHHNDDWLPTIHRFKNLDTINQDIIRRRKTKYVPAYGGRGEVLSDFVFDLYRSWFEDSALKVRVPVINASMGGARIRNTEEKTLEDMLVQCSIQSPTPGQVLDRLLSTGKKRRPERLKRAMRDAVELLKKTQVLLTAAPGDEEAACRADEIINSDEIKEILRPFLRRTQTYLSRYAASPEESKQIMTRDAVSAMSLLVPAMEAGLRELESLPSALDGGTRD
jgi:hypothetical protein